MLCDPRVRKLARLLVRYSTEVVEGDKVLIVGSTASEPLLREVMREVLDAGGHPSVRMSFRDADAVFYAHAQDHQLDYEDPLAYHEIDSIDVTIRCFPDLNPHALSSVPADKKQRVTRARKKLTERFMERWAQGGLRWVGSAYPTPALAQEAKMSLEDYAEFVFGCGMLDEPDPIAYWKDFSQRQERICRRLNGHSSLRYVGLDTDIRFGIEGRTWMNCDGKVNFPDGEVFTGPVEDSVEGEIRFTYPGIFQGQEVEDIRLRFEKGRVVEAHAATGEELLRALLDTDEGSRVVGEVAIGTNAGITRFTKNMLFDEKMGGTIHVAVGAGIPTTGSKNVSAVHWDMLKDMREGGRIYVDDELVYEDGAFLE
jgi:aminopeptidase